jgi:hypothetical protein
MSNETIARGADNVRRLLTALGGELPQAARQRAEQRLIGAFRDRFEHRQRSRTERERLTEPLLAALLKPLAENKELAETAAKLVTRSAPALRHARKPLRRVEPQITGSVLSIAAAPYNGGPIEFSSGAAVQASEAEGSFNVTCVTTQGGSQYGLAGISNFFWSVAETPNAANPMGTRLGVLADIEYAWLASANFATAHSDGSYEIWVWGVAEDDWVLQTPVSPSWSDGASWLDNHGSDDGPGGPVDQRSAWNVFFPTRTNSWYLAYVLANGSSDGAQYLFWFSNSWSILNATVDLMVFAQ